MKLYESNSSLGYNEYVILLEVTKDNYLIIDTINIDADNYRYKIGELVQMEKYELEETNYLIENSPLKGTYLFEFFLSNMYQDISKEQVREQITPKVEEYIKKHGISNIDSFIDRTLYFYERLKQLSDSSGVTPLQYLKVIDSNYRALYDWVNVDIYTSIIKRIKNET
jgi:hypothetical protein